MLQNAYLLAEIGADTAENERLLAEILLKTRPKTASGMRKSFVVGVAGASALEVSVWAFASLGLPWSAGIFRTGVPIRNISRTGISHMSIKFLQNYVSEVGREHVERTDRVNVF